MDYEKLGVFYLGREVDPESGELEAAPLLYDSRDLTTNALCVGMTGSGKTGLCIGLLEEAALDGVPALILDPKGDLGNLPRQTARGLLLLGRQRPQQTRQGVSTGQGGGRIDVASKRVGEGLEITRIGCGRGPGQQLQDGVAQDVQAGARRRHPMEHQVEERAGRLGAQAEQTLAHHGEPHSSFEDVRELAVEAACNRLGHPRKDRRFCAAS